jgi:hypothetical protein
MIKPENPFVLSGYFGEEYFCDRKSETERIIEHASNGTNTTLMSIRRMGKTGLIHHVLDLMEKNKSFKSIYLDIYATQNLAEMTNQLAGAVLITFTEKHTVGRKFMEWIKSLRPVISIDPITGNPQVSIEFKETIEYEKTLGGIFRFLDAQGQHIFLAIDEFQQILNYPEQNVEALFRTNIQPLKHVRMLFSGSNQHLLTEMFHSGKRPFYQSSQTLKLGAITNEAYTEFIRSKYAQSKRSISDEAIDFVLDYTRSHTYYTQKLMNRIFSTGIKKVEAEQARLVSHSLLLETEHVFYQYRQLLTSAQWQMLRAIAREGKLYQPHSKEFNGKYRLGQTSVITRSIDALMTKEMIFQETDDRGTYYEVYDCFLSRWLEVR